jgi:hypothetical protein
VLEEVCVQAMKQDLTSWLDKMIIKKTKDSAKFEFPRNREELCRKVSLGSQLQVYKQVKSFLEDHP